MMGLGLVCALGLTLSIYMTPSAAATTAFIFCFGSTIIVRALTSGYEQGGTLTQLLFKFLNAILPQFTLFDLGSRAANVGWSPVPLWVMVFLLAYWIVYSSGLIAVSWAKFQKKAI
jgi:hypothetical protein